MPTPLLATKLHVPVPRRDFVPRPRLSELLTRGLDRRLTLVSAPAGSGKTTLIAEWLAGSVRPAAWLTLDEDHKNPAIFLAHLIAAMQTVAPRVGEDVSGALLSPQPPAVDAVLATLIGDLAGADPFILVLDDYHAVDAKPVEDVIGWLVEHLPRQVHMVITTRVDPALPLARMRAKDQLTELRASDLRFSPPEATGFLMGTVGLELSTADVAALVQRTEGWIAGLQLAGLSLQGHQDPASFIASFTGSHRFVLDYLVEEVLLRQSPAIQEFLLRTSVLDRLSGPLCDALTWELGLSGQETLEHLEDFNLFVIPLDDERHWYRYHHLFAESLGQRLSKGRVSPSRTTFTADDASAHVSVEELHLRASRWYERHDFELEAFRHAAAANDIPAAERLMDGGQSGGTKMPLHFRGAATPISAWLDSLPVAELDARPSLWVARATVHTFAGVATDLVEIELQAAEAAMSRLPANDGSNELAGRIAVLRAMQAIPQQRVDIVMAESRRALDLLGAENYPQRTAATWTLGFAHQLLGERREAIATFSQAVVTGEAAGNIMFTIAAATSLGQVLESQNEAHAAADNYRRVVRLAGEPPLPANCEAHLGLARVNYEWDDLPAATQHGRLSLQLARLMPSSPTPASCGLLLARVERARGDLAGAIETLAEAERFARGNGFDFHLRQVVDEQVRTLLAGGDVAAAAELADRHNLAAAKARVHLAQNLASEALAMLRPLNELAVERAWGDELLRVGILQALAYQADGDSAAARRWLGETIDLAAPAGFVRVFLDEGEPIARLLAELLLVEAGQEKATRRSYVSRLLAAFADDDRAATQHLDPQHLAAQPFTAQHLTSRPLTAQPLQDPLTARELEVLRLIAAGLSNADIGRRLFRALATVKGHNRVIFAKLEVESRTEAVARARELGLL